MAQKKKFIECPKCGKSYSKKIQFSIPTSYPNGKSRVTEIETTLIFDCCGMKNIALSDRQMEDSEMDHFVFETIDLKKIERQKKAIFDEFVKDILSCLIRSFKAKKKIKHIDTKLLVKSELMQVESLLGYVKNGPKGQIKRYNESLISKSDCLKYGKMFQFNGEVGIYSSPRPGELHERYSLGNSGFYQGWEGIDLRAPKESLRFSPDIVVFALDRYGRYLKTIEI